MAIHNHEIDAKVRLVSEWYEVISHGQCMRWDKIYFSYGSANIVIVHVDADAPGVNAPKHDSPLAVSALPTA